MARDVLYISDIPSEYHYVSFNGDYIDLFNKPSAQNETLNYYRIWYKNSPGTYTTGTRTFSNYNRTYFDDYPVSNSVWYRPDLDKILLCVFIIAVFGAFLINLITSIVKKRWAIRGSFMRRFIIFIFIIILVSSPLLSYCSTGSDDFYNIYESNNGYTQDVYYLFNTRYDNMINNFTKYCIACYNNTQYRQDLVDMAKLVLDGHNYFIESTGDTAFCFNWITSDKPYSTTETSFSFDQQTWIPVISGSYWNARQYYLDWTSSSSYRCWRGNTAGTYNCPVIAIGHYNELFYGWCNLVTGNSNLNSIDVNLKLILAAIQTSNDKLDSLNDSINEVNDTLKNEDDSDVNYKVDTPTVTNGDSEGAFDNIFSRFVNSLTSDYDNTVAFPIPFTYQHIFIDSSFTSDVLSKIGSTTNIGNLVISMLSSVWYFLVGMYILHDIQKIKDDIKTGAIMNKTDTNIKTEML